MLTDQLPMSRLAVEQMASEAWQEALRRHQISNAPAGDRSRPYSFYGRNLEFVELGAHERILSGPAETGKTITCLWLLNQLCWSFPGLQAAIVRKTYKSMPGTVLETFEKKILPVPPDDPGSAIEAFGGKKPERYIYPNRSTIWLGGMDNPERVLSSERDVIYVNQAEELTLEQWETLTTRVTGRAGNIDEPFIMGDCNPAWGTHWILARDKTGSLKKIDSRHEDNPVLYDQETGELTVQGKRSLSTLDSLTGVRHLRLRIGQWITEMPGALWTHTLIEKNRAARPTELARIVVAVDPAVTAGEGSNETGIMVQGIDQAGNGYVLDDLSGRMSPEAWARAAVDAYRTWQANLIVGEVNNGGDLVERNIRTVEGGANVSYKSVRATRGKYTRAEPVSSMYTQGKIKHCGTFPELEDQMCTWLPGETSPDRLDGMVWGFTELFDLMGSWVLS